MFIYIYIYYINVEENFSQEVWFWPTSYPKWFQIVEVGELFNIGYLLKNNILANFFSFENSFFSKPKSILVWKKYHKFDAQSRQARQKHVPRTGGNNNNVSIETMQSFLKGIAIVVVIIIIIILFLEQWKYPLKR